MKRYWLRGFVSGVVSAFFPAVFFSYKMLTWKGFYGLGNGGKKFADDPLVFILWAFIIWTVFGLILGIIGTILGWVYGKTRDNSHI